MKTNISIEARRFPVTLRDERTGEIIQSSIILDKQRLQAAQLVGQYEIVTAEVAQKALPECNIVFIEGDEMKEKLSGYLSVLFEQNPQSVGGALPDDAFYFSR